MVHNIPNIVKLIPDFFIGCILAVIVYSFLFQFRIWDFFLPSLLIAGYILSRLISKADAVHPFTRFCLGEAAAVALWLQAPLMGVIIQILILSGFLISMNTLNTRRDILIFLFLCSATCGIAYGAYLIQHTYLLVPAVLLLAGGAVLIVLLMEYRITRSDGGES